MIDQGRAACRCRQISGRTLGSLAAHVGCVHGEPECRATFKVWLQAIAIQEPGQWDSLSV